ncbi:MAG: NAD+ synthase [Cyanobacteriota bacterium]|nr:NAD+ synthase [Cyanobacteriota bacterium]
MLRLALAQLNPTVGALGENRQKILASAQAAAAEGADLFITSELALCGYPPKDLLLDPSFGAAIQEQLHKLAQDSPPDLTLLVGAVSPYPEAEQQGEKPLWNSAVCLRGGKIIGEFHKSLLPNYDVFDERRYFASSRESGSFMLKNIRVGVTLCEDLWNDEGFWGRRYYDRNPLEQLRRQGVDLIVNLSASPYSLGKPKFRRELVSFSAGRLRTPIVYVNQVGGNDDLIFDGASFGVNRRGEILAQAPSFQEALAFLDWDGDLQPGALAPRPESAEAELWDALVLGTRDYCRKCGFSQAVLGLSGGVDSALVAAVAVEALGRENVRGILMPSPYSSEGSVTDAEALAKNLGIQTAILPIAPLMSGFDNTLEPVLGGPPEGVTAENLQSRIRGVLLMAVANHSGALLLTTGNKSEIAAGYCTLYGDMNGGLAVIGDAPKTQVYGLCRWLNRNKEVIPDAILTKAPSAELKPGQTDQDSLPPYEILDAILDLLIHRHQSLAEIIGAGYDRETAERVAQLVRRAEFKRRQAPPSLKVTDRAFGAGWRMPIACRGEF